MLNTYKNLVFISCDISLNTLIDIKQSSSSFFCTLNPSFLLKNDYSFINLQDYIDSSDLEKNYKHSTEISKSWKVSFDNYTFSSNVLAYESVHFVESGLNSIKIIENLFSQHTFKSIKVFSSKQNAFIRTNNFDFLTHVFINILKMFAENNKIKFDQIFTKEIKNKRYSTQSKFNYKKLLKSKISDRKLFKIDSYYNLIIKDVIYNTEIDLCKKINNEILHSNSLVIDLDTLYESSPEKNYNIFISNSKSVEHPYLFNNKYLDFQFNAIKNELCKGINIQKSISNLKNYLNFKYIFLGADNLICESVISELSQNEKIETVSLIHNGISYVKDLRFLGNEISKKLVWNDYDFDIMSTSVSQNKNEFLKIGTYKFHKANKKINLKPYKKKEKNILLLTANINRSFSSFSVKYKDVVTNLELCISNLEDENLVIRNHPSFDDYELYLLLIKKFPNKNIQIDNKSNLSTLLQNCDFVLGINYLSTAHLEAMLYRKLVLYIDWKKLKYSGNELHPLFDSNIKKIESINEFKNVLKDLRENNFTLLDQILEKQNKILSNFAPFYSETELMKKLNNFLKPISKNHIQSKISLDINSFLFHNGFNATGLRETFQHKNYKININKKITSIYMNGFIKSSHNQTDFKSLIYLFFKFKIYDKMIYKKFIFKNFLNLFLKCF